MYPLQHLFLGAYFAMFLFLFFPPIGFTGFLIIFLSSVLIDVDHYLFYVYKKKDFNLRTAYGWYIKMGKRFRSLPSEKMEKSCYAFCFFHGVEILIIFLILSFFSKYFLYISIGFAFHLILDIISELMLIGRIISKFSWRKIF